MDINLKETLRKLRNNKGVTQEALAKYLGITPQSVGKWERGEGFPDITLLPKLALYFDVTVDELLSIDRVRIEAKINEYLKESSVCKLEGDNAKNLEIWERAYAELPNECRVIEELMFAINRDALYPCPPEKADRIILLAEKLLEKSIEIHYKENALQTLAFTYSSIGNKEKALQYADQCGTFHNCAEGLKTIILDGEEGVKARQSYIQSLIHTATSTSLILADCGDFDSDEKIEINQFAIDILKNLYSDGNYGFAVWDLYHLNFNIASEYALQKDKENTLKYLEESCKYSILDATLTDMNFTALMVNRLKLRTNTIGKNYTGNYCNIMLESIERDCFQFVRDEKVFDDIVLRLNEYAEKT